ncbi:hypothetical protein KPH14_000527, partial [Odynerus spinipes]
MLTHPAESAPLLLTTDASDMAIGASFEQILEGIPTNSFFSRKLRPAELNYSAYDRELLAMYAAVKHFKYLLEGRANGIACHTLQCYIDYTSFTSDPAVQENSHTQNSAVPKRLKQKLDKASPRQARHLDFIAQFVTDIIHLAGNQNMVADALSRIDAVEMPVIVTTQQLADEQANDEELQNLLLHNTVLDLKKGTVIRSTTPLYCDCSTDVIRPYVPKTLRKQIFHMVHRIAHPS